MKIRGRAETYTPAAWAHRSFPRRGGGSGGGGGGQIKLRREIYGRACNEQLFHGMRTPGLASGGGISIRSSSCRPRASRSPSAPTCVALPEFCSAQKGGLPAAAVATAAVASDFTPG